MHFFRRIAASLENIQQRNVVDKRRLLRRCLFGMQKRGILERFGACVPFGIGFIRTNYFADRAKPPVTFRTGLIDGVPHVILATKPVMDGVGFLFIIPIPVDSRTDLAEPSVSAVGANVNVRGVERIGCT